MVTARKSRVVNRETKEEEEAMVLMMMTHPHPQVEEAEVMIRMTPVGVGTPVRTEMTRSEKRSAVTGGQEQAVHQQAKTTTIPKSSHPRCQVRQRSAAGKETDSQERASKKEWKEAEDPAPQVPHGPAGPSPVQGSVPLPGNTLPHSEQEKANTVPVPNT